MKKQFKVLSVLLVAVLLMTSAASLMSCSSAKDAIDAYMPSFAGTAVKEDFTLPRLLGDSVKVKWKSNSSAIEIVKQKNTDYLAKLHMTDEIQPVELTVSAGGAKKTFQVRVQKLSARLIANAYVFAQSGRNIYTDFDLDTVTAFNDVTATITWEVADEASARWLSIVNNNKCVVEVPGKTTKVTLNATFNYKGDTAMLPFSFNVNQPTSHREEVNNWYTSEGVTMDISGYVVGLNQGYGDDGYSTSASFYMVDDDLCSGYYVYASKNTDSENGNALQVGAHVTVTGATSYNYNGLWEATMGSTFVVDTDIATKTDAELVYAFDNDILSGSTPYTWHMGALVSLTNWQVTRVWTASTSTGGTLLTISKDGVTFPVAFSNSMRRFYKSSNGHDDTLKAIEAKAASFKVGDTVSVKGIISYYNGFQVLPRSADDIVAGTKDTSTSFAGSKVKSAISAVQSALVSEGLIKEDGTSIRLVDEHTFNLPTKSGDVEISYSKTFAEAKGFEINGGAIKVSPDSYERMVTIEVEYKVDGYTTYTYFQINAQDMTDEERLEYAASSLANDTVRAYHLPAETELPATYMYDGLTVKWSIKDATSVDYATLVGNKLTVTLPLTASQFTLVAELSYNDLNLKREIVVDVDARVLDELTEPKAGDFILGLYQANNSRWNFATGALDSNSYGVTDTAISAAATFTIAASGSGYTIQVKSTGKYLVLNSDHKLTLVDETSSTDKVWNWNTEANVFTYNVSGTDYYLGSYGTYNTVSASPIENITGANANTVGVSNFVAHFGTAVSQD